MRTLFCSLLLVASLLLAPTAMAWDAPVSKASVTAWQEIGAIVMGWFEGSRELGPTTDPDGVAASEHEQSCVPATTTGEIGPGMDPEG
ncbi:MAG: hypothetical protein SX243_13630 [Acidobacteriota bacterium]|nr:hypothetical protein [Acidobacteriota bacterium]